MVIGCGMIGMGVIVCLVFCGVIVIVVDLDDEKLEFVKWIGVYYIINFMIENVYECLIKIMEGFGFDVVIEVVGSFVIYVMVVNEVGFIGRVVCIGYVKLEVFF